MPNPTRNSFGLYSRRNFLSSAAAIPFYLWLQKNLPTPAKPHIRYNALTPQGQANLKIYAEAVKQMMALPSTDPISWVFQWYTHWVPGPMSSGPKAQQINTIFGPNPSPHKTLAQDMWDTCQSHGPGEPEDNFLPWHRMYVFFLEEIVRKVAKAPAFTLPYWNYSVVGPAHGIMPDKFRLQASPIWGSLYRTNRNAGPNQGHPIDQTDPGALDLTALNQTTYSPSGAQSGFCQDLDFGLHGNVHVLVGNTQGMGQVPYAAGDPIFWMHHCNIDRLWASWNKCGRTNPTDPSFLNRTFTFADVNGNAVTGKISDFLSIAPLHYTYDHFETPSQGCKGAPPLVHALAEISTQSLSASASITLGASAVRVELQPPTEAAPKTLTAHVQALAPDASLYVVLKKLRTDIAPGVLYHVYLNLPEGTAPEKGQAHHIGTINFFSSVQHEGHEAEDSGRFYSFDITSVSKSLHEKKLADAKPNLTIVPFGKPESDAKPLIGEITLVRQ